MATAVPGTKEGRLWAHLITALGKGQGTIIEGGLALCHPLAP